VTPSQRYTYHCHEARVIDEWFPMHQRYGCCGAFWEDGCQCEPHSIAQPLRWAMYTEADMHDERTEDIECGKPLSNGSSFYTEE
jgi:hypothetical protein